MQFSTASHPTGGIASVRSPINFGTDPQDSPVREEPDKAISGFFRNVFWAFGTSWATIPVANPSSSLWTLSDVLKVF